MQDKIDQNRRAGGKFSGKSINVQGGSFFVQVKINMQTMVESFYHCLPPQKSNTCLHIAFLIENIVKNVKITIIQSTFKIGLKRAGWNICAGGIFFFSKSINVQTQIRPCRRELLFKINKRACASIRYTRVISVLRISFVRMLRMRSASLKI